FLLLYSFPTRRSSDLGTSPYNYLWTNGESTEDISGLSPDNYSVTITDAHSCSQNSNAVIIEPALLSLGSISKNVTCYGSSDGFADRKSTRLNSSHLGI